MGTLYEEGKGVEQDFDRTFELLELVAAKYDSRGLVHLGWMHAKIRGCDRSRQEARRLYKQAADLSNAVLQLFANKDS